MKFLKWLGIILLILIVIYFLGPSPTPPKYTSDLPAVPSYPSALDQYVSRNEAAHKIKPDNEARIVWANDSLKGQTEYAVVYLHGFSASQGEGEPIHREFAKKFGCNLYLSRLAEHGIDTTEPMIALTADKLWNSAQEAYAIGKQLGKKVVIMGTSTGATLALKLAADYPEIAGLILYSPNIAINDPAAWILNNPWGLQAARLIQGKYNESEDTRPEYKKYWTWKYRMEAAVALEELLETTMKPSLFEKVKQPVLMMYYYKDDVNQDSVVKVSAMLKMYKQLGTPDSLKEEMAVPNAHAHVITSPIKSKDVQTVASETEKFGREILHLGN